MNCEHPKLLNSNHLPLRIPLKPHFTLKEVYRGYIGIMEKTMETTIWDLLKIRGTFLGIPIVRTIIFWGLYWGPPILGNYNIGFTLNPKPQTLNLNPKP